MAFDYARLAEIDTIGDTVGAIVTNAVGKKTYIRHIIIHNTNSTTETINLHTVPDNAEAVGTAADINRWVSESILAGTTWEWNCGAGSPGIILEDTNDTLQASTDTASKVTIQVYGGIE